MDPIDYSGVLGQIAAALLRIADAHERLVEIHADVLLEHKSSNVHLASIAESNYGQWMCCTNGSERSEALLDVVMNHPEASPQEKFAMRDAVLKGG